MLQVRLCLARKDFTRAQILIRKVSPRAFVERPDKKGQNAGEVGIEGTTIEAPDEVTAPLVEGPCSPWCTIIRDIVKEGFPVRCRRRAQCSQRPAFSPSWRASEPGHCTWTRRVEFRA
jgi:hypothetical protein